MRVSTPPSIWGWCRQNKNLPHLSKACGYNGYLEEASRHKMAAYVLKDSSSGDTSGGKKLTKAERQAQRAAKQRGEDEGKKKKKKKDGSDDDGSEVEKKKKKKKHKTEDGDDDDDDKKKKKKKDKKEKKSKKKERDEDSDEPTKASSDDESFHKDDELTTVITNLRKEFKEVSMDDFLEEVRLQGISCGAEKKTLMYMLLDTIFTQPPEGDEDTPKGLMTGSFFEKNGHYIAKFVKDQKMGVTDMMWAFEMYVYVLVFFNCGM